MNKFLKYATDNNNALGITVNLWRNISFLQLILTTLYFSAIIVGLFVYKIISFHILPKNNFFLVIENIVFYLLTGACVTSSFFILNKINKFSKMKIKSFKKIFFLGFVLAIPQTIFYTIFSNEISAYFLNIINEGQKGMVVNHFSTLLKYFAIPSVFNGFIIFTLSTFMVHLTLNPNRYKGIKSYLKGMYRSLKIFLSLHTTVTNIICLNMLFAVLGLLVLFLISGFILGFVANKEIAGLIMFVITITLTITAFILLIRNIVGGFFKIYEKSQVKFAGTAKAFKEDVSYGVGECQYIIPDPSVFIS